MNMEWQEQAACVYSDPELFFPHPSRLGDSDVIAAKRICAGCPVRAQCADYGRGWAYGIYGGLTAKERGYPNGRVTATPANPVGTERRLRALAFMGYTAGQLASMLRAHDIPCKSPSTVQYYQNGARVTVTREFAEAVKVIYRQYAHRTSDDRSAGYVRNIALVRGWMSPSAWHGRDIDDPAEVDTAQIRGARTDVGVVS